MISFDSTRYINLTLVYRQAAFTQTARGSDVCAQGTGGCAY